MNYTHRINHLSFGDVVHGVVSPLDGEEKITTDSMYCNPCMVNEDMNIIKHNLFNLK